MQTPPGWFYTDAGVYARIRERAFVPSWQFVADTVAVRVPTQVHPVTVLDGCVGEPVLLTRDKADRLHCVFNVCTHRGRCCARGRGTKRRWCAGITGGGSIWTGRSGTCRSSRVVGFPSESDSLAKVPFGVWGT